MNVSFGDRIRFLRENKELNQSQLGSAVNMTQRKISYIENNQHAPSLADIQAFGFLKSFPYPKNHIESHTLERSQVWLFSYFLCLFHCLFLLPVTQDRKHAADTAEEGTKDRGRANDGMVDGPANIAAH